MTTQQPLPTYAALVQQVARQQVQLQRLQRRRQLPRRLPPLLLAVLLVALIPLTTLAAWPFGDVTDSSNPHFYDIQLMSDSGITRGCGTGVNYCPLEPVTRQQMASFLARTAGLGANPPVVNAKTALEATHATNADLALNSNALEGLPANSFNRFAYGYTNSNIALNRSYQTIVQVTITAPTAGYVLLTGWLSAVNESASGCTCIVSTQLWSANAAAFRPSFDGRIFVGNAVDIGEAYMAYVVREPQTWVVAVNAGSQTFGIQAILTYGSAPVSAVGQISLAFSPFAEP